MRDDADLLARARRLETDALAAIHDLYYPLIYRAIAFRIAERETIEDLTGEVFARFLTAVRDRRAPRQSLGGWLYRVALNVVNDHHRRRYRSRQVPLHESLSSEDDEPAGAVETRIASDKLREALADLTAEQQQVVTLRFGQGMSVHETATLLAKSEGAVKQLQARALAALAKKLAAMENE